MKRQRLKVVERPLCSQARKAKTQAVSRPLVTTPTKQEHDGVRASSGQNMHQDPQPGRSLRTDKLGLQGRVRDMEWRRGAAMAAKKARRWYVLRVSQACDPGGLQSKSVCNSMTS